MSMGNENIAPGIEKKPLSMIVNGKKVGPLEVPVGMPMIDFLHHYLNLTGTHFGCGQGVCHACTVVEVRSDGSLVDTRTCIANAHAFDGKTIITIEGQAKTDADGKETTVKKTISETVLTINLTHKSYTEMIAEYGFNAEQTEQLNEMMSSEYDTMWAQLLGGYSTGTGEIIISNSEHIPKDIFAWALPESYTITSPFGYRSDPFTGKTKFHGGT